VDGPDAHLAERGAVLSRHLHKGFRRQRAPLWTANLYEVARHTHAPVTWSLAPCPGCTQSGKRLPHSYHACVLTGMVSRAESPFERLPAILPIRLGDSTSCAITSAPGTADKASTRTDTGFFRKTVIVVPLS